MTSPTAITSMFAHLLFLVVAVCIAAPAPFREPFLASNASLLSLKRSTSQNPSCPSGFLCEQNSCPASAVCPTGETCLNFEGTLACIPNTGLSFCAINPTTRQAVGCDQGVCCHGNCYVQGTICCNRPQVQCSVGELCNACPSAQTCTASGCSGDPPSPTTTTSTKISTTTSATSVGPTVVPTTGTFSSIGCYADAGGNRVLTTGSFTDYSSTGMTVEKCAELAYGYQYAAVEYYGECYWGDLLSYRTEENAADCNTVCNGDPTEICGGGNRLVIYQDSAWVVLSDLQYAAALQAFQALLQQLQTAVAKWHQDLKAYYAAVQAAQKRRKRVGVTLTQQGITVNLDQKAILEIMKPKTIKLNLLTLDYYLKIKINQRQKNAEAAAEEFKSGVEVIDSVIEEMAKPNVPVEIIPDGVIPTAIQVAAVSEVVTVGTEIATTIGGAAVVVEGVVTSVATGIFAIFAAVLAHFLPASPGGGGDDPPTTTTTTTTTSTTCSPTMSPTSMAILMKEDATAAQYKDLVLSVPDAPNHVEIVYELVNFRVLIANINDCDIKKLWDNPIVETMSLEGPLILDDADDAPEAATKREAFKVTDYDFTPAAGHESNVTVGLSERALDALIDLRTQPNSPWHLRLLSGLSNQVGLNGLFYDFPGYLFADRSTTETTSLVSEVNIYIFDTGIRKTHSEFKGRIVTALDATNPTQNSGEDVIGHGTRMASLAAGNYAGVAKTANIVSVKKGITVESVSRGIGMILDHVARDNMQGRAVINMSFGAFVASLYPTDLPFGPKIDIIGAFLNRLYKSGIVVVCSAGNNGHYFDPLNDMTPRIHGGRGTPLIVVGATTYDEERWDHSQVLDPLDQGILSIYANGYDVVAASNDDDDLFKSKSGTSEAAAIVSGVVAYFLANDVLHRRLVFDLGSTAIPLKAYIRERGTTMKGIRRIDPATSLLDFVPRAANGEQIDCTTRNGVVNNPAYQDPPESQEILPAAFTSILVTEGIEIVVPQNQLPSCVQWP